MNFVLRNIQAKHGIYVELCKCARKSSGLYLYAPSSAGIQRNSSSYTGWAWEMMNSKPVLVTQELLQNVHDTVNLPWWATIIVSTCVLRATITLPLTVYQHYISAKYINIQPRIKQLAEELKKETQLAIKLYNWPKEKARYMYNKSLRKHIHALIIEENCHPLKGSLVLWLQIPLWICVSFALRSMSMIPAKDIAAEITLLQFSVGGILWFPNLLFPDSTFILPVMLGIINLAIIEMHSARSVKSSRMQTVVTNLLRGFCVVMVPIAATVPSCVALYWTTSSAFGLAQNVLIMSPRVRKLCRIPTTSLDSDTPYQDLVKNIKKKLRLG